MKVGLITFHDTTNFGSLLQTYGLYRAIENCGVECEVIDYQCKSIVERELPRKVRFTPNPIGLAKQLWNRYVMTKKYNDLSHFLKHNMQLGTKCNRATVTSIDGVYDKYVVGSDIVWGMDITDSDTAYFLDFVSDKNRKLAYASSVGTPWSPEEKSSLRPLLQDFNAIAVRENESADWVEELTSERPDVVCDPTMLLSGAEWSKHKSDKYKGRNYVFVYFNDSEGRCLEMAKEYAKQHNLEVYYVNYWGPIKGVHSVRPYSLEDFLSLIFYAQRVFTASYHGMLFSVYFERNFIFFNRAHKSRMRTLAQKLNVENCDGASVKVDALPIVDYNVVNQSVEEYRNYSMERLRQMLKL